MGLALRVKASLATLRTRLSRLEFRALLPLVAVEFVSTFLVRPFSLAVRLFANMLAGHFVGYVRTPLKIWPRTFWFRSYGPRLLC